MPLQPGDKAPEFTLLDQEGSEVSLGDFKGRKVLLYFAHRQAGRAARALRNR